MRQFHLFLSAARSEPVEAAVVSRAVVLFLLIVIGLGALLAGIILLNRSRRLRRVALEQKTQPGHADVDPWKESARRIAATPDPEDS
jgi:hypothetical protein